MIEKTNVHMGSTMVYSGLKIKIIEEIRTPNYIYETNQYKAYFALKLYMFLPIDASKSPST
jgi:hypothetical protein